MSGFSAAFAPLSQLLACQPVCSSNHDVIAFDLSLQSTGGPRPLTFEDLEAVIPVALESYTSVVRQGRMLAVPDILHVPPQILQDPRIGDFPRKQFILETDMAALREPELTARLRQLFQAGHRLALGGIRAPSKSLEATLPFFEAAAVETSGMGDSTLSETARYLRERGVDPIARQVDTRDQLARCLRAGFTHFQGRYLNDHSTAASRPPSGNSALLLQLLARLQDPETSVNELEALAVRDPALTYRLLRLVNSAAVGARREVDSLSQAITLLGTDEIRRWLHLFLAESGKDVPEELARTMLVRARTCEIIADLLGRRDTSSYFVIGLLSRLELLMQTPLKDIIDPLPLSPAVREALLHRRGEAGEVLAAVERFENGGFDGLETLMDPRFFEVAFRHATNWARQAQLDLHNSHPPA